MKTNFFSAGVFCPKNTVFGPIFNGFFLNGKGGYPPPPPRKVSVPGVFEPFPYDVASTYGVLVWGQRGRRGQKGAKGDEGDEGGKRAKGANGVKGTNGTNGRIGRKGRKGAKGTKGTKMIFITLILTNSVNSPKNSPYWVKQKMDKIVTQIVTKCGDHFITSILTISGRSPKKSPNWVKQKVTESSHELSQNLVIISSP